MIREIAPAKINLYLHVGPVRADGLHELASLFVFAADGDLVEVADADALTLEINGPFAPSLAEYPVTDNLVFRAAALLRDAGNVSTGAAIKLMKNLPVAAGIGGGSADAAAALVALRRLWRLEIDDAALGALAFQLGADVPACLHQKPVLVTGAGEKITPARSLPPLWITLVNSGDPVATGAVFRGFDTANPAPDAPEICEASAATYPAVHRLFEETRNDLTEAATVIAPVISDVTQALRSSSGCLAARMSGSGATCFGLFASQAAADAAARRARARGWWAMASRLQIG